MAMDNDNDQHRFIEQDPRPRLKHRPVCRELTTFCAIPYPYQITIKIIQRVSSIGFCMLERGFSRKNCSI